MTTAGTESYYYEVLLQNPSPDSPPPPLMTLDFITCGLETINIGQYEGSNTIVIQQGITKFLQTG